MAHSAWSIPEQLVLGTRRQNTNTLVRYELAGTFTDRGFKKLESSGLGNSQHSMGLRESNDRQSHVIVQYEVTTSRE